MTIEVLVLIFLKAQAAAGAAILLVLALRLPARRLIGPELSYRLWTLAPAAAVASLFPTLSEFLQRLSAAPSGLVTTLSRLQAPTAPYAAAASMVWLIGAVVLCALFVLAEVRFQRRIAQGRAGPAITGAWPRMVVPADYRIRFSEAERGLIREHEREHMARGHLTANRVMAALLVISWFNPLAHLAAACARMDQELACDAAVVARHPRRRRDYAETLLKAHAGDAGSPFACAIAAGRRHPLEVRVALLAKPPISMRRDLQGVFAVGALAVTLALALWSFAPL